MKYDGIILDIDGTIWNTTEIVAQAWNRAVASTGLKSEIITAQVLQKKFGKPMNVIANDLWPHIQEPERTQLLEACVKQEQKAIEENTVDITYKNVVSTIKSLSSKVDFYIVSNCHDGYIETVIEKNGLTGLIKDFESFGKTGLQKNENIALVCKRNNIKNPVYVGDTQGDCDACKKANVPFIWAAYGFGSPDSFIAKLDDFSQLESIINQDK